MEEEIVIGRIVAPHGVRGDIRILPLTEKPDLFLKLRYLYLGSGIKLTVTNARFQKNMVLVSAEEIKNMDEAEKLRNQTILLMKKDLPPLPKGRFYVSDLKGFVCLDEAGKQIGVFQDALPAGSTDVFVIQGMEGKEILVPAIKDNILEIDTTGKRILVRLPEWMD